MHVVCICFHMCVNHMCANHVSACETICMPNHIWFEYIWSVQTICIPNHIHGNHMIANHMWFTGIRSYVWNHVWFAHMWSYVWNHMWRFTYDSNMPVYGSRIWPYVCVGIWFHIWSYFKPYDFSHEMNFYTLFETVVATCGSDTRRVNYVHSDWM